MYIFRQKKKKKGFRHNAAMASGSVVSPARDVGAPHAFEGHCGETPARGGERAQRTARWRTGQA